MNAFMNAFYEQMHMHAKDAQFSICPVHFTAFPCPLCLLVLAALNLRAGPVGSSQRGAVAWSLPPSGAWSWVGAGGWAAGWAEGCAEASTSMGAALGAALGLG